MSSDSCVEIVFHGRKGPRAQTTYTQDLNNLSQSSPNPYLQVQSSWSAL